MSGTWFCSKGYFCLCLLLLLSSGRAHAQDAAISNEELLRQLNELRKEVQELRKWKEAQQQQPSQPQPVMLQDQPPGGNGEAPSPPADQPAGGGSGEDTADPAAGLPGGEGPTTPGEGDNFPMTASYRYNAGGGYTQIASRDGEFTLNIQNQFTLDGTFYSAASVNTPEKGFNIPFYRTYLFGNITKDWDYQAAVQGFLGSFNILDMWLNHRVSDKLNLRFGRMLTPLLYEYYAFSPAWEPVITNSPLFQVAGKRQLGAMVWGRLFHNKIQYQQGVYNGISGGFFNLDRGVDYIGDIDWTPFKGSNGPFAGLGGGLGVQSGWHQFSLAAGATNNFVNGAGEPTVNPVYVNSTGIPFFVYGPNMITDGMQNRFAPHLYWFGRFSVLGEYVYQTRALANTATGVQGVETLNGYYVNLSYFLTGEKYTGDGLAGYTTISPRRPFQPSKGCYGPGAWELVGQYSQMALGNSVLTDGFADPIINATRLDQLMLGVNWWMNKYTRASFDWVNDQTNKAVPIGSNGHATSRYDIYWVRLAMFF